MSATNQTNSHLFHLRIMLRNNITDDIEHFLLLELLARTMEHPLNEILASTEDKLMESFYE